MALGAAWAQIPWAGSILPAPPLGQLPPPIPGDPARYSYFASLGKYPWAYPTWAGGYPLPTYPGGGVLADPDTTTGVMRVQAWWPSATAVQLVRLGVDGSRTPVRGAYPIVVSATATRRNSVTNPSIEAGLNGFVPDVGSPTLSQLADTAAPAGSYVLRATNAGAGSNGVTVPTSLATPPSGAQVTVGFGLRVSALPTSVTVSIGWLDGGGGALSTNSATLSADQRAASVAQFSRQVITVTPPAGAVTPTLKIAAGGMPAGGQMDLDALTFEVGTTDASFFDGRTLGGGWVGTADLSVSLLAPVQTVLDGECPLDTIVSYQVSYPAITGGRVVSDPAYLPSNAQAWLTHPLSVGAPVAVTAESVPTTERAIQQGVFLPIGASRPVVVSSAQRQAPTGTLDLAVLSFDERDTLLALLADGSPVLLRAPSEFGYSTSMWLAIGTVTEDRGGRKAWQDALMLSAEFVEVDAPAVT